MTGAKSDPDALYEASRIIDRFGGIRPMSTKTRVPVTTIQGWKKRGMIPGARRDEILLAARENGIDLSDLLQGAAPPANENEGGESSAPIRFEEDLPPSVRAWHGMRSRRSGTPPAPDSPKDSKDDRTSRPVEDEEHLDFSEEDDEEVDPDRDPLSRDDDKDDDVSNLSRPRHFPKDEKGDDEEEDPFSGASDHEEEGDDEEEHGESHGNIEKEDEFSARSSKPDLVYYHRGTDPNERRPVSVMQDKPYGDGDLADLMDRIKTVEVQGGRHMTLIASALIAAALAFTMFVFWPTSAPEPGETIAQTPSAAQTLPVQGELSQTEEESSSLFSGIKGVLDRAGQDSAALKDKMEATVDRARTAVATLSDPAGGSLPERIQSAAQKIELPGDTSVTLAGFAGRLEAMARDVQGQQILQTARARLQTLAGGGDEAGVEARTVTPASLDAAREQDPALAQTFAGVPPEDLKAASLLLAFSQVRESLDRGNTPFNKDLDLLLNLVGDSDPALRESLLRLAPQAEKGILTPSGLVGQFKSMAGDAVMASLQGEDVSFEDRAMARLNQVLQVEKNGELVTGTDTQAKIARAQAALDAGDVEGAVTELEGLDGPAAQTARPWIDEAQAVVTANQIKQMFAGLVSGSLSIGAGGGAKYTARSKGFSGLLPQPVIRDPASGVVVRPNGLQLPQDGPLPDVPPAAPAP